MKIHVLTTKADIEKEKLDDKIVIVLDILFATSSIVAAMANGCHEVIPSPDSENALLKSKLPEYEGYLLSGELNAETLDGFIHPTPLALISSGIRDNGLIYCTTNGTVALHEAKQAKFAYAGSLLNGEALVQHILKNHMNSTVLIVCSGSQNKFNLEDFYGAGQLIDLFKKKSTSEINLTDSALASLQVYKSDSPYKILKQSRVGQMMLKKKLDHEIKFAAQENIYTVIPKLNLFGNLKVD